MLNEKLLEEQQKELSIVFKIVMAAQIIAGKNWDSYRVIKQLYKKQRLLAKLLRRIKRARARRKRLFEEVYLIEVQQMIDLMNYYLKQEQLKRLQDLKEARCMLLVVNALFTTSTKVFEAYKQIQVLKPQLQKRQEILQHSKIAKPVKVSSTSLFLDYPPARHGASPSPLQKGD